MRIEYKSSIFIYRYASVGNNWKEKYGENEEVLSLIPKLLSADDSNEVTEEIEELLDAIGENEDAYLDPYGEITIDDEPIEGDYDEYGSIGIGGFTFTENDYKEAIELYEDEIKTSKVCVIEDVQNKRHIASIEINAPFEVEKLKYVKGWIEYDGKPLESEGSEGNAIDKFLFVDGKAAGSLDFTAEVKEGMLVIGKEYLQLIDAKDGDKYEIKVGLKQIRLVLIKDEAEEEE